MQASKPGELRPVADSDCKQAAARSYARICHDKLEPESALTPRRAKRLADTSEKRLGTTGATRIPGNLRHLKAGKLQLSTDAAIAYAAGALLRWLYQAY